jgi:hypothetical protein
VFTSSALQNVAEFLGATLGLVGLFLLGIKAEAVCVRGDSRVALKWASAERFSGDLSCNASLVFILTAMCLDTRCTERVHIDGATANTRCDLLSRRHSPTEAGVDGLPRVDLEECSEAMTLLRAGFPDTHDCMDKDEESFRRLWEVVKGALFTLRSAHRARL